MTVTHAEIRPVSELSPRVRNCASERARAPRLSCLSRWLKEWLARKFHSTTKYTFPPLPIHILSPFSKLMPTLPLNSSQPMHATASKVINIIMAHWRNSEFRARIMLLLLLQLVNDVEIGHTSKRKFSQMSTLLCLNMGEAGFLSCRYKNISLQDECAHPSWAKD